MRGFDLPLQHISLIFIDATHSGSATNIASRSPEVGGLRGEIEESRLNRIGSSGKEALLFLRVRLSGRNLRLGGRGTGPRLPGEIIFLCRGGRSRLPGLLQTVRTRFCKPILDRLRLRRIVKSSAFRFLCRAFALLHSIDSVLNTAHAVLLLISECPQKRICTGFVDVTVL